MLFSVYGIYFFNNGSFQDNGRFSIIKNSTNTANAEYIAQVIDAKGNFYIEHDGILAKTNNISNGDTILLKKGAQLVFEITSGGTQSKIIGPAKLIIQQTHNKDYKLNLIYGDFIQVEGNEWKAQTIELAINDIIVKQEDKSKPVNFKFIQDGEQRIFQNNGANIIVTKSNGEEKTTTITKQQVVAIQNNDIKIFANIESFTKAIQQKNISQTFALATNSEKQMTASGTEEQENIEDNTITLLSLLDTKNIGEIKEEITQNISTTLNNKKILDPKQDEKVNISLYQAEYIAEIKVLEQAFIEGNESAFATIYAKVEKRIQTIYQSFWVTFNRSEGDPAIMLKWLRDNTKKIKDIINTEYNIPPEYIENLQSIEKSLSSIIAKWRGSITPVEKVTEEKIQQTINE